MVLLAALAGLRIHEIAKMPGQDIDLGNPDALRPREGRTRRVDPGAPAAGRGRRGDAGARLVDPGELHSAWLTHQLTRSG
jgi:hypothetical protein